MKSSGGDHRIRVGLRRGPYDVIVGSGVLGEAGRRITALAGPHASGRCFVGVDAALPSDQVERLVESLQSGGLQPTIYPVRSSEEGKTLTELGPMLAAMAEARLEREDPVVALGGGVIGDLVGFAASVYRRGVPVVQCPTTLLAMVDASVGGKTGVNLHTGDRLLKNMVGSFHQPMLVLADVDVLGSLPPRHLRSALAECLKHGLIAGDWGDPGLFEWTLSHAGEVLARDAGVLTELVARNVAVKAVVVADDELEQSESPTASRALLNLGHTFGHAIETLTNLTPSGDPSDAPLHHGEAVGLGLVASSRLSVEIGVAPPNLFEEVRHAVEAVGLPVSVDGLPPNEEILERMRHDKKARGGRLRVVLPTLQRRARVFTDPPTDALEAALDAIRT